MKGSRGFTVARRRNGRNMFEQGFVIEQPQHLTNSVHILKKIPTVYCALDDVNQLLTPQITTVLIPE